MANFYFGCIAVGFTIPLVSIFLGGMGSLLSIDVDFDGNTEFDAIIGFNLMCLCMGLAVMGLVGRFTFGRMNLIWNILLAASCGAASYIFVYRFIVRPLKRNNPAAIKDADLIGLECRVTLKTSGDPEIPGVITLRDSTGAAISYPAVSKHGNIIDQGEIAEIVGFDVSNKTCLIENKKGVSENAGNF